MPSFSPVGITPRIAPVLRQFPGQPREVDPQGPGSNGGGFVAQGPQGPATNGGSVVAPGTQLFDVLTRTNAELQSSLNSLASVPPESADQAGYTAFRRDAYDANMRAQNWLASGYQNDATPSNIVQTLHEADAKLEYANWKTVGKDPRTQQFVGFDIIGAMNDTMSAATMVQSLLGTGPVPPGPTPPNPGDNLPMAVRRLLSSASSEAASSAALLQQVPQREGDNPQYTPMRREAYSHNMASQKSLARLYNSRTVDPTVADLAHQADAQLETANWSTVGKDPQTQGKVPINIQASLTATNNARAIIDQMLQGSNQQQGQPHVDLPIDPQGNNGGQPQADLPVQGGRGNGGGDG